MPANKILQGESMAKSFPKINQAIQDSFDAITKATRADQNSNDALVKSKSVQTQLNQIVIEGDSSVEAAQARVDNEGFAFGTLKERLDEQQKKAKFQQYYLNVQEYGAKGDGFTPDSDAIQRAVDQKGYIWVPKGLYMIDKTIVISSDTHILMHPKAILKRANLDVYAIFANGKSTDSFMGYNGNKNIHITGGTLDLSGDLYPKTTNGAVIGHGDSITFHEVNFINGYNAHFIELNSTKNAKVTNCNFDGYAHDGARAFGEAIQIDLAKAQDVFPTFGSYDKTPCENITVENCNFKNVGGGVGTHVTEPGVFHDDISIRNNTFEDCLDSGVTARIMRKIVVEGNKFLRCNKGIYIANCYEGDFRDNNIKQSRTHGLEINNSSKLKIIGGSVTNSEGNGITVYGNSFDIDIEVPFVLDNGGLGVNIEGAYDISYKGTVKRNGIHGVWCHDGNNFKIEVISAENNRHGIQFTNVQDSIIQHSKSYTNNQSNDGSSNIILVSNSSGNRIVNTKTRAGGKTNKPVNGLLVASGCNNNIVIMNDFANGGTAAGFRDDGTGTVTSTANQV